MAAAKTALITGVAGQDGALLAAFLQEKGYKIHGLVRWDSHPSSAEGTKRLNALGLTGGAVELHTGDITDAGNVAALIKNIRPGEIYNLAALSHVQVSFDTPAAALDINVKGTLNVLEAVRLLDLADRIKIYQASSSEMFGRAPPPQNEDTPFQPCSPYGVAKPAAYHLACVYREAYGLFVANGILFNHESPWRGQDFVTAKIAWAAAAIEAGHENRLRLGSLDARRDWGHARDYVRGMWMMLQRDAPGDYVLATGRAHSVRDFTTQAFAHVGVRLEWRGHGEEEQGVDARTGRTLVEVDPALFRPVEVHGLLGDVSRAERELGWRAETGFEDLVSEMVNAARALLSDRNYGWQKAS